MNVHTSSKLSTIRGLLRNRVHMYLCIKKCVENILIEYAEKEKVSDFYLANFAESITGRENVDEDCYQRLYKL